MRVRDLARPGFYKTSRLVPALKRIDGMSTQTDRQLRRCVNRSSFPSIPRIGEVAVIVLSIILVASLAVLLVGFLVPGLSGLLLMGFPCLIASALLLCGQLWSRRLALFSRKSWFILDGSNIMHWKGKGADIAPVKDAISSLIARGYAPCVVFDANVGY